jgi:phospholipid-binding lipoprotein MlaA
MRRRIDSRLAGLIAGLWLACVVAPAPAVWAQEPPSTADTHQPDPLFDESLEESDPLFDEADPLFGEDDAFGTPGGYPDPIERVNRGVLGFNRFLDRWLFDPVTRAYQFAVPTPARRAVHRLFLNLNSPVILANDILQMEWQDAGVTLGRFVVNSTAGVAGLFDVAERMGFERHESDFGQTLRLADVESGPYLIVPILGPSTVRDTVGGVMDSFFNPTTWFFGLGLGTQFVTQGPLTEQLLYSGTSGLTLRDAHYESLKALEDSSVDFYAALRNAYYQNRKAEIWDRREHRALDWEVPY